MLKKLLYLPIFLCGYFSYGQLTCPLLTAPMDGDTNVPVDTNIAWSPVVGVTSYLISIGTTPGGSDIIDNIGVGNDTEYQPPLGLPESTDIYITITLFLFDADNVICASETFRTEDVTTPPQCTTPNFPVDGSVDVDVATSITWNYAPKATGYRLILGTAPGGNDLFDGDILGFPIYDEPSDLPVDTEIFVRIIPFNENGPAIGPCPEYSFTTSSLSEIPDCTMLTSPLDGAINVPLATTLEWNPVPRAEGYRVSIGTSPTASDILDDGIFSTNTANLLDFLPRRTFFVRIVPFNDGGEAIGCTVETFSTILGCDPFIDSTSGELVSFSPEIDFPDRISLCSNDIPLVVASNNAADGYRWYLKNSDDTETLISDTAEVLLFEEGEYRHEIFDNVTQSGTVFECSSSREFTVISSESPRISDVVVTEQPNGLRFIVEAEGQGEYEFALALNGPFQDSNVFVNLPQGPYTVFVRDKNGCGLTERALGTALDPNDFPKFFTPNGDGINDFWQYRPQIESDAIDLEVIYIFGRLGNLLARINPDSRGWDGNLDGIPLPSSDYWFKAKSNNNQELKGHFALKR